MNLQVYWTEQVPFGTFLCQWKWIHSMGLCAIKIAKKPIYSAWLSNSNRQGGRCVNCDDLICFQLIIVMRDANDGWQFPTSLWITEIHLESHTYECLLEDNAPLLRCGVQRPHCSWPWNLQRTWDLFLHIIFAEDSAKRSWVIDT